MAQSKLETHYCINCGKEAIEQHHVVPLVLGGNDIISNKVWLCSECHAIVHGLNKKNRGTYWKELQAAGIAKAKAEGKYKGRKPINISNFKFYYNRIKNGENKCSIAEELKISRPTLYKLIREYELTLNN